MKTLMGSVSEQIKSIRLRVQAACEEAGRRLEDVRIVAVAKGFTTGAIEEVVKEGISDIGENYWQESQAKLEALKGLPITWHFTGHLQRNKALPVARHFELIHSLDSFPLAEALNEAGRSLGKKVRVLIQLKRDPVSYGFLPEHVMSAADQLLKLEWLEIGGVMIMAPLGGTREQARSFFEKAQETFFGLREKFAQTFCELSMGMTDDFEVAVQEGATLLRIGRGIFGERQLIIN